MRFAEHKLVVYKLQKLLTSCIFEWSFYFDYFSCVAQIRLLYRDRDQLLIRVISIESVSMKVDLLCVYFKRQYLLI